MFIFHRMAVFLGLFFCGLWTLLMTTPLILLRPFVSKIGPSIQRLWGWGWCQCLGIRITILHSERIPSSGGFVIAPNHASLFDILVVASLPMHFRWISKAEVGRIPFVGGAMRSLGAYFLLRGGSPGDLSKMKQVEEGLRAGFSVLIFPEGTRSPNGALLPFKKGAVRTAQNAKAPIVPVGLSGTFEIAPKGKIPVKWGHRVIVNIGEPIFPGDSMDSALALSVLRDQIQSLVDEGRGLFPKYK